MQRTRTALPQRPQARAAAPFFAPAVQPKLTLNAPGDAFEREADRVADTVTREPGAGGAAAATSMRPLAPSITRLQRKCAACAEEERVQRQVEGNGAQVSDDLAATLRAGQGRGHSLPDTTRHWAERSFGTDFGGVRVHTDANAAGLSRHLNAQAFTHGADIYFGDGQYAPGSQSGRRLLAHELTHVVQQRSGGAPPNRVQRQTDSSVEAGSGVDQGISAGTMVADAIMGRTFTATCGFRSYSITFTFAKAYRGTYPYRAAGRDVKGVYVKIEAAITDRRYCGRCTPMRLLQVIRNTTRNSSGDLIAADPQNATRRERSGWNDPSAPSRGWRVDRVTSATNPFYSSGSNGKEGSETTPAILWDAPGDWSTDTNAGKDFYSCAVCQDASGRKWVAGCVHWGYFIDGSGNVAFEPATPAATCGHQTEVGDAAARWDAISGNTATGITF